MLAFSAIIVVPNVAVLVCLCDLHRGAWGCVLWVQAMTVGVQRMPFAACKTASCCLCEYLFLRKPTQYPRGYSQLMLITICWRLVFYRRFPQSYIICSCFSRCWQFDCRSTGVLLTGAQWQVRQGTGKGERSVEMRITKVCFWVINGFSTDFSTAYVDNFRLCCNALYVFSTISISIALLGRMCRTCRPVAHLQVGRSKLRKKSSSNFVWEYILSPARA